MNDTFLLDGSRLSEDEKQALLWLDQYAGDFNFLKDMQKRQREDQPFSQNMINAILRCKARDDKPAAQPARARAAEEGWYISGDEKNIYKVQKAVHGNGRNYAKRLVQQDDDSWAWEYEAGAVYRLADARRLTLEEAQEFGRLYGVCCICGAILTDERSIEEGIGPICGGRFRKWLEEAS